MCLTEGGFFFQQYHNNDAFQNENDWNANDSYTAGGEHRLPYVLFSPPIFDIDGPEYGPGAIFGASGVFTSGVTVSPTATSTAASSSTSSTHSHSGGHGGAIAGGVIGGIAGISIISVAAIFYLRRRGSKAASAGVGPPEPILDDEIVQPSSASPLTMKFYVRSCDYVTPIGPFFFLLFSHTPRTQMTQQHTRDTKVLQFLRSSDPEAHCRAHRPDRPHLIPRANIVVCPCPIHNAGHHRITGLLPRSCLSDSFPWSLQILTIYWFLV